MDPLIEELLNGSRRAAARMISLIENDDPKKKDLLSQIYPHTGKAYVLGITGAPGSGKSSLVDRFLDRIRVEQLTAGVIAVDPSSPFTGGAILGDRIRMQDHAADPAIFIRSMGTRGALGGLSRFTREAVQVLDALGKDLILIETVGVGQSEVDIVKTADTTILVLTPAGGDSVQTIKAGVMEIADIFVVNKSDLPGVDRTVSDLNMMLEMSPGGGWRPPVIKTVSTEGIGIDTLYETFVNHRVYMESSGLLENMRQERVRRELVDQVEYLVKSRVWDSVRGSANLDAVIDDILTRKTNPYSAAEDLLLRIRYPGNMA